MSNDPKPIREVFLAGDVCHELFVITNTNVESPQRWYERHTANTKGMAPPMQRHGGILLTKGLIRGLFATACLNTHPDVDEEKLPWVNPRRDAKPLASTPLPRYYQTIYGLQERKQLTGSDLKTFRMMTLLSKEFVSIKKPEDNSIKKTETDTAHLPPSITVQLAQRKDESILVMEELDPDPSIWGGGIWTSAIQKPVETVLVKTNQPKECIGSYLKWRTDSLVNEVVFIANVTTLLTQVGGVHRSWDTLVADTVKALFPEQREWFQEMTLILLYGSEGCLVISNGHQGIKLTLHWDTDYSYGAIERRIGWVPGPGNVVLATLIGYFLQRSARDATNAAASVANDGATTPDPFLTAWLHARTCMILGHERADGAQGIDQRALKSLNDQLGHSLAMAYFFDPRSQIQCKVDDGTNERTGEEDHKRLARYRDVYNRVTSFQTRAWTPGQGVWERDCKGFLQMSVRKWSGRDLVQLGYDVIACGSKFFEARRDSGEVDKYPQRSSRKYEPFPLLKVGDLIAIEQSEVEQISYLDQLIRDYADRRFARRPLSIGVFGKPGAGKSFAVKQILKELAIDATTLEFNLSPMNPDTGADLIACFRRVQSCALRDREFPLVFWDEFDSRDLRWLQHFLAPMQDGEFYLDGDHHSIGRALFVFAGGTCTTMEEFKKKAYPEGEDDREVAITKKAPDFFSRLKASYDVPDVEVETEEYGDSPAKSDSCRKIIQRALLIRQHIRTHARHIQTMDRRVAHYLLTNRAYGSARELENVIEASALRHADHFGISALAPKDADRINSSSEGAEKRALNVVWD